MAPGGALAPACTGRVALPRSSPPPPRNVPSPAAVAVCRFPRCQQLRTARNRKGARNGRRSLRISHLGQPGSRFPSLASRPREPPLPDEPRRRSPRRLLQGPWCEPITRSRHAVTLSAGPLCRQDRRAFSRPGGTARLGTTFRVVAAVVCRARPQQPGCGSQKARLTTSTRQDDLEMRTLSEDTGVIDPRPATSAALRH